MDLENFLHKNSNKEVVVVQGLDFVGAVMSLVVANSEKKDYAVIGIDLKKNINTINSINSGKFPIKSSMNQIDLKVFKNKYRRSLINKKISTNLIKYL